MSERVFTKEELDALIEYHERRKQRFDFEPDELLALIELRTLREENEKMRAILQDALTTREPFWLEEMHGTIAQVLAAPFAGEEKDNG